MSETETTNKPVHAYANSGRGIELTFDALISLLRQRFPEVLPWDLIARHTPSVDVSPQTRIIGLYWTLPIDLSDETVSLDEPRSAYGIRFVGEGMPIPTRTLQLKNLVLSKGPPRCGSWEFELTWEERYAKYEKDRDEGVRPLQSPNVSYPKQCALALGHEEDHDYSDE